MLFYINTWEKKIELSFKFITFWLLSFFVALADFYYFFYQDAANVIFVGIITFPVSFYLFISTLTEPEKQHNLYWAPFCLILIIAAILFFLAVTPTKLFLVS